MLDNNDIEKLIKAQKEAFKEDFSTRKEIEHLIDIVATKADLEKFENKTDTNINKIINMLGKMDGKLDEVVGLKHRVEYIETTLNITALKNKY